MKKSTKAEPQDQFAELQTFNGPLPMTVLVSFSLLQHLALFNDSIPPATNTQQLWQQRASTVWIDIIVYQILHYILQQCLLINFDNFVRFHV